MRRDKSQRGFSLMELLVTVSILTILAAIAIPSYRNHVIRVNRSDAVAALQRLAAAQEKFYMQNNSYADSFGEGGLEIEDKSKFYGLEITSADTTAFEAKAEPIEGEGQDSDTRCWTMTIDNQGRMTSDREGGGDTTSLCFR